MAFVSMTIATRSIKQHASGEGGYNTSSSCNQERNGDLYREGDDDDDGGYHYAPAA
ncbi:hypothetical protein TSUD_286800 [Trifolium subterraneum]|uniref:Uncharacterized protein n=1 Tax=Trifolium subterraneum TaxID=3900 RepID=A0A2Z6MDT7_TRISU|nr:hypothetical protein TSUD_286800 [Trifolium subterraneum]